MGDTYVGINCHHNVAQLRRLRESFPEELVVIGVHSAKFTAERPAAAVRQAVLRLGITHPVVNDPGHDLWQAYCVRAWPTLVLIDPRGYVVAQRSGEVLAEEVEPLLRRLVARAERRDELTRVPAQAAPEALPEGTLRFPAKVLATAEHLYVADSGHHRIVELAIARDGRTSRRRVWGDGEAGLVDGAAARARFRDPHGLAVGEGRLFVADTGNHAIRAIDLDDGEVATVAGSGQKGNGRLRPTAEPTALDLRSPWDLLWVEGVLLVAMAGSHQVWSLLGDAHFGLIAGTGREALADGPAGEASFSQPSGLALLDDRIYVADAEASAVRVLDLSAEAEVSTLVGQGLFSFGDRDGPAADALLQHPTGIAIAGGLVYVADTYNHKIRTVDLASGEVATLCGDGRPGAADGPLDTARLDGPEGLAADPARPWLWVADTGNHKLRRIDLDLGTITTVEV